MSVQRKQSGFAVIETILVVAVLAIVGFTGYYVWHSQQQTNKALDVANDTAQSVAPKKTTADTAAQKYLTIKEWGVKIPLTTEINDAYYVQKNGYTYLSLNSYKGTDCAADSTTLGVIIRFASTDKDDEGTLLSQDYPDATTVGSYRYSYNHPQAACDGRPTNDTAGFDDAGAAKSSALMNDFKTAVDGIVSAK